MCNVIPVKCKRVSTHTLMFWAGLGNVIFSFLCLPLPKLELDTLFQPETLGIHGFKCLLSLLIQVNKILEKSLKMNNHMIKYSICFRMVSMDNSNCLRISWCCYQPIVDAGKYLINTDC